MNRCFVALGSNLENPTQQLNQAIDSINALGEIVKVSPFYKSTAVGPGEQPDYINAALELNTKLSPIALLDALQAIENSQGRVRTIRFGPRTLDLDILLFNNNVIREERLEIPHPRMFERNFVIFPLMDIAANLVFPNQKPVSEYGKRLSNEGLEKLQ